MCRGEFGRLVQPDHEPLELVAVKVKQILHGVEASGCVKFVGVGQAVPRVVDDRLHQDTLFRGAGDLGMQVGQAIDRLDLGGDKPVKLVPWDIHADQAPVHGWPVAVLIVSTYPLHATICASPLWSAAKTDRTVRSAIWAMMLW